MSISVLILPKDIVHWELILNGLDHSRAGPFARKGGGANRDSQDAGSTWAFAKQVVRKVATHMDKWSQA